MKFCNAKNAFLISTILTSVLANAAQNLNQSSQDTQTATAAANAAFAIAQQEIMKDCVTPTADLMCNSTTQQIVGTLGGLVAQLAVKGVGGQAISGAIGGVSCLLIKCDTTETRNSLCAGTSVSSVVCPTEGIGTAMQDTGTTCKGGAICTTKQETMNLDYTDEQEACNAYPVNVALCVPAQGKHLASQADCQSCILGCDGCLAEDNATVNNSKTCETGPAAADYTACITTFKAKAKERQSKCRKTCAAMVATVTTLNALITGVTQDVDPLRDRLTNNTNTNNNNGGGNGNNNNFHGNNNNNNSGSNNNNANISEGITLGGISNSVSTDSNNNNAATISSSGSGSDGSASGAGTAGASIGGGLGFGSGSTSGSIGTTSSINKGAGFGDSASGGAVSSGAGAASSEAEGGAGGLRGITKKKGVAGSSEILSADVDLFKVIAEIHTKLYTENVVGDIVVVEKKIDKKKISKKNISKKKVRR